MASILRSSKFVRYIAGFARHVVINTPREFDGNFINSTQCFCSILPRNLASQVPIHSEQNLDLSIKRLDQDVRRSGRISRRDIEDVLEEIKSTRTATSSQSLMVIRCCGNLVPEELPEVRTQLVQEIWNTLIKLNVPMDISHYNALLRVYLENHHAFLPTEFLSELESKGIEPNRVTYQRLITRYCQMGDIEGATRILEFMREKQLPVNENVFNSLIMGHCQTGDMESAQGILSVMLQAGLEPSADTFTTLICGFAKTGDIESINKLMKESEDKEIYLLDKDYLDIVYELSINGHGQHIPAVLDKVRKTYGYAQDAINVIYRLINNGKDDDALLVLKSMPRNTNASGNLQSTGGFFIHQMVRANRPTEVILRICDYLEREKMNENAFLIATERSLETKNEVLASTLLGELHARGMPIRQHYFWPLLVAKGKDLTNDGIIKVLKQMANFNLTPNTETIRDYVIPNIKGSSTDIISILREVNISIGSSAYHLLHHLLQKNNMQEALLIVSSVSAYYVPSAIRKPLSLALYYTKDVKSYVEIIHHIYEHLDRRDIANQTEKEDSFNKNEVIGEFICDLTINRGFPEIIVDVLKALVEEGLSISNSAATKIQDTLGEKLTPEVAGLLAKLSSGDLIPVTLVRKPVYTPTDQMTIPQLERLIENLSKKGNDTVGLKRQLLTLYCRVKDVEKVEDLLESVENDNFIYSSGVYAQLMDLYATNENLEQTLRYYEKLRELDPDFALDDVKVIRVVALLIANKRFDEGVDFLNNQSRKRKLDEQSFSYRSHCWRILNLLAEEGREEELNILFDTLVKNEFVHVNNILLGPLIKVHLVNNNVEKALEKFEWCCNVYKATPWKSELACKLIQQEDAENLQRLTDLSTSVHGEINSLYDLVFAFVDCGRVRQARKILETPGLQVRPQRLNNACQRYHQEGMVKSLEGLKDATKDLNHIDRSDIYYQLLLSYIKEEDNEKATGLWVQMQEENVMPSDQFLFTLAKFLTENGKPVPFAVPQYTPQRNLKEVDKVKYDVTDWQVFRQALKAGKLDAARNLKKHLRDPLSVIDGSHYIELLLVNDHLQEATTTLLDMVNRNAPPITRVFRFALNKLSNTGDIRSLNIIASKLSLTLKKLVSFDNRLCHTYMVAGKSEDFLSLLENEIDNAKEEDLEFLSEKFPRGGVVGIIENMPALVPKYETLVKKYAARGILSPMNVLWAHYFINGNEEKANEIWHNYLHNTPRIMFQRILQKARETSNEQLITKLMKVIQNSTVSVGALGNAHSCLLDILCSKGKDQEVVTAFEDALKSIKIDNINRTAILRVKEIYEKLGKPFNYVIPPKKTRSTNNYSSHTDDEGVSENASRS